MLLFLGFTFRTCSSSTSRVNKSPGRVGNNPSQQSLPSAASISCDTTRHQHLRLLQQGSGSIQGPVQPQQISARSLPLAGTVDDTVVPSLVQLPTGGSLRYPQRVMLVVPRRADGTIGRTGMTTTNAPPLAQAGGGFLVMLPTTSADQRQQTAWLSAIQQQQQQRPFSPVNGKGKYPPNLHFYSSLF